MPVGDTADYVKIRDDWLWSRSQSLATVRQGSEERQLMYVHDLKGRCEKIDGISQHPPRHIQRKWKIAFPRPIDVVGWGASVSKRA